MEVAISVNERKQPQDAVLDRLIEADRRLDDPVRWYRYNNGGMFSPSFGLLAAIDWLDDDGQVTLSYLRKSLPENWQGGVNENEDEVISDFNDDKNTTFKMMKDVLKRAIELRKQDL